MNSQFMMHGQKNIQLRLSNLYRALWDPKRLQNVV